MIFSYSPALLVTLCQEALAHGVFLVPLLSCSSLARCSALCCGRLSCVDHAPYAHAFRLRGGSGQWEQTQTLGGYGALRVYVLLAFSLSGPHGLVFTLSKATAHTRRPSPYSSSLPFLGLELPAVASLGTLRPTLLVSLT